MESFSGVILRAWFVDGRGKVETEGFGLGIKDNG